MKSTVNIKNRIQKTIVVAVLPFAMSAGNKLSVVKSSSGCAEIILNNSEPVAALQFSLRSSSAITLLGIDRSAATQDGQQWIVSSYKADDSTINVVVLNIDHSAFASGTQSIGSLHFTANASTQPTEIRLEKVVAANPAAQLVTMTAENLELNAGASLADAGFSFGGNYPNPFNPSTHIAYKLEHPAQVRLAIYDVTGRELSRLVDGYQTSGQFSVTWNSVDGFGRMLPSGIYFAQLVVDGKVKTHKMILSK